MRKLFLVATLVAITACQNEKKTANAAVETQEEENLTVYTHRHYESDQNLFEKFEEETGIQVNVINASADELIQKMKMEGEHSPADVLITVDAGRLHRAKEQGLLQPIDSELLEAAVPAHLQDKDNQWFGFSKRARIIAYARDRVKPEELSTYEDLASDKWNDRILIRSSGNIYNQSLLASLIANSGEAEARAWAAGVEENMAREPRGSDRDQVKAVVAGEGDIAVLNSYYLGQMLNSSDPEEVAAAQQVGIFFPNQEDRGTHINVSGAGVAAYAPNKENAVRFIEFLLSEEAQKILTHSNYEYPINPEVEPAAVLLEWGDFREDDLNLSELGANNKKAVLLFDEVGWK